MAETLIEWAFYTFNIVWGCVHVSEACRFCYAEKWALRLGLKIWGVNAERRTFGEKYWAQPLRWNKLAGMDGERRRVFCSSMADVFEDHPTVNAEREKLWPLIKATPRLDWLLLTKRPENFARFLPADWGEGYANVQLGVTAEDQQNADRRIRLLVQTPARLRFVSCEPLLGPIDLIGDQECPGPAVIEEGYSYPTDYGTGTEWDSQLVPMIDQVIVGGESGTEARPMHPDWARSLRDQCQAAGVAFFFKQNGEFVWRPTLGDSTGRPKHIFDDGVWVERVGKKEAGRELDGRTWDEMPEVARA